MSDNRFDPAVITAPEQAADSSEVGFLAPDLAPRPYSGETLDDLMQYMVAGITGLPLDRVRPRWQQEPPNLPPIGANWAAVGVTESRPLGYPASRQDNDNGQYQGDTEEFDVLCSFYGPLADNYATILRAGLMVNQNREQLQLAQMGLIQTSGRTRAPSLLQSRFMQRVDITLFMRRQVQFNYPVLTFLSAPFTLITDSGYTVSEE